MRIEVRSAIMHNFFHLFLRSNPVWLVNTRLMLQKKQKQSHGDRAYKGIIDCFFQIYEQEGLVGYIKGVDAAMGTVLNTGIQFMT